jgi:hypothetical protein
MPRCGQGSEAYAVRQNRYGFANRLEISTEDHYQDGHIGKSNFTRLHIKTHLNNRIYEMPFTHIFSPVKSSRETVPRILKSSGS